MSESLAPGPGVRIPPPVICIVAFLTALALDRLYPSTVLPVPYRYILGFLVILGAGLVILPVLTRFRSMGTPFFDFRKPASALITDGPYQGGTLVSHAGFDWANPHFSSPVYYVAAIIRPGCVSLGRPPRRTVQVRLRRPRSQALPGRPLRRLATTGDEKCGLSLRTSVSGPSSTSREQIPRTL